MSNASHWHIAENRLTIGQETAQVVLEFPVPAGACDMSLSFRWAQVGQGHYVRLQSAELDAGGNELAASTAIVGERCGNGSVGALFHLTSNASRVRIAVSNAYHDAVVDIEEFEVAFLANSRPAGAVGLIAPRPDAVPELLRDMVENYQHYRETALAFSKNWIWRHDPVRTIEAIESNSRTDRNESAEKRSA